MLGRNSMGSSLGGAQSVVVTPPVPSSARIPADAAFLHPEQVTDFRVTTWDSPFTPLVNGVASSGLALEVREPIGAVTGGTAADVGGSDAIFGGGGGGTGGGTFDISTPLATNWARYAASWATATASNLLEAFRNPDYSVTCVADGRVANVVEYWSTGAPAWYGATQRGRIAMHWHGQLRDVVARDWFSSNESTNLSFAIAGSGYVRITKTVAGTTSDVLIAGDAGFNFTEADFLANGFRFTSGMVLSPGDSIDIYYVQTSEAWGGLTVKVMPFSTGDQAKAREAAVLGCGLFDSGEPVRAVDLSLVQSVEVTHSLGAASSAVVKLPLINPTLHDGFGYEWRRTVDPNDPGYLVLWDNGIEVDTIRRDRLVRIAGGLSGNMYNIFTGVIQDFEPDSDGIVSMQCIGFEQRAIKTMVKSEPDEISYMTWGFNQQVRRTSAPVYGIQAYDSWDMEFVIQDILYRVGIDASRFSAPLVATQYDGTPVNVEYGFDKYKKFRARNASGGGRIRLERSAHYGNIGDAFNDLGIKDDAYIFAPDATREPWSRVREIADRYGYDVRFDHLGDCVLQTRGNAQLIVDVGGTIGVSGTGMTGATGTKKASASAYGGQYMEWTGAVNLTFTIDAARIDASLPRGPNLGPWTTLRVVRTSDEAEVARISNYDVSADADTFHFDYRANATASNATVLTLFSGDFDNYRVEVIGAADGKTRRLDMFLIYASDPVLPKYPGPLSTDQNALSLSVPGVADDMRNLIYVIGRRKTAATDSTKFSSNPNNPDPEFVVDVAVDPESITDPTAVNFVGARREAAIYDDSITDQDYASYLARTFVYRYRMPRPPADIVHTVLPMLELRDPISVRDAAYRTVNELGVLWVTKYTHAFYATGQAETQISTASWPEFPSYEPREDIDIFKTFHGCPVTNVDVRYTSLSGADYTLVNMPASDVVYESTDDDIVVIPDVPNNSGIMDFTGYPWPPIPGSEQMAMQGAADTDGVSAPVEKPDMSAPQIIDGTTVDVRGTFHMTPGMFLTYGPFPDAVASPTTITVHQWKLGSGGVYLLMRTIVNVGTTASEEFWFEWNDTNKTLRLHWNGNYPSAAFEAYYSVVVSYKTGAATSGSGVGHLANTPYHHYFNVDYRDNHRKFEITWKHGNVLDTAAYYIGIGGPFDVKYRKLGPVDAGGAFVDPYNGVSPFADVTASDLGYVSTVTFDALITGYYRISVCSVYDDTVVAYLTDAAADATDPEAHWEYITAGPGRSFNWDFVDQVGLWNEAQSDEYAATQQGLFELQEKEVIGAGWVVWNRETKDGSKFNAPLALIAGDRDKYGRPVYGQGRYAQWYIKFEVDSDFLRDSWGKDSNGIVTATSFPPIVVKTIPSSTYGEKLPVFSTADADSAVIYTHLPEPTRCDMRGYYWNNPLKRYTSNDTSLATNEANWALIERYYDGHVANQRPVRMVFMPKQRPGALWEGNYDKQRFKISRHVHAKFIIHDQFAINKGVNFAGSAVKDRTVVTRKLHIDDHTVVFEDSDWRTPKSLYRFHVQHGVTDLVIRDGVGTAAWVFEPQNFKRQFNPNNPAESVRFADYLQVTEVPSWATHTDITVAHSRFIMGFWACLFYLSAYVQDISGRRSWCIDRSFLDPFKIATNAQGDWYDPNADATSSTLARATADTFLAEWPIDPLEDQTRTVFTLQWIDEPNWQSRQRQLWGFKGGSIGDLLLKHSWHAHNPYSGNLNEGIVTYAEPPWPVLDLDQHSAWHNANGRNQLPSAYNALYRQLGSVDTGTALSGSPGWSWETDPLWIPCVSRDWHGFFKIPAMPDHDEPPMGPTGFKLYNTYAFVFPWEQTYDSQANTGRDAAAAAVWSSWTSDMTQKYTSQPTSGNGKDAVGVVRFAPGTQIDTTKDPNKPVNPDLRGSAINYLRQDETVHYEELRGMFSRGPRPLEQPRKATAGLPYYINHFAYAPSGFGRATLQPIKSVPTNELNKSSVTDNMRYWKYLVGDVDFWTLRMRMRYNVESSSNFPVNAYGEELLQAIRANLSRHTDLAIVNAAFYDKGAWTGWKDDGNNGVDLNIFLEKLPPIGVGPSFNQEYTSGVWMHMCLVNERRAAPLALNTVVAEQTGHLVAHYIAHEYVLFGTDNPSNSLGVESLLDQTTFGNDLGNAVITGDGINAGPFIVEGLLNDNDVMQTLGAVMTRGASATHMPTGDFTLFCVGRPEYALFAPVRMFGFSALGGSTLTLTASTNPQGSAYRISAECNSGFFVTDVNWSGTRSNNGQFDVIIITQKGGLLTFYKNGRIVPQSTYNGGAAIFNDVINSPASGSGLSIANPPTGPWFAAQLDVAECGVYDNALSDTEIGELFGSMSDKYGIPVVGHNAPASISEISGLWAWQKNGHGFYTDAGVTPVADQGDLVYQWSDQSGQGHHWIQTGDGFRATYDGETTTGALLFDSSLQQHYQLPNMSGLTQATIFICVRAFNDPGIAGGVGSGLWALGTDNNAEVAFPDVNGNILDDVGRPSAVSGGNPVASLSTQYRVYSIRVGGVGAQIFSLDYDTITSQTSTTVTFPTTPYVGRTRGNSTGGVKYFLGRVCEFVVFDRRLSDIEHESVINDILERV